MFMSRSNVNQHVRRGRGSGSAGHKFQFSGKRNAAEMWQGTGGTKYIWTGADAVWTILACFGLEDLTPKCQRKCAQDLR